MPLPHTLLIAQSPDSLVKSAFDPFAGWIPHAVSVALMLIFGWAYWRGEARRTREKEGAEEHRYKNLRSTMENLVNVVQEMRLAIAGTVTVDQHRASIKDLHDKFNLHSAKIARLLERNRMSDDDLDPPPYRR